jgi:hypothetical protein
LEGIWNPSLSTGKSSTKIDPKSTEIDRNPQKPQKLPKSTPNLPKSTEIHRSRKSYQNRPQIYRNRQKPQIDRRPTKLKKSAQKGHRLPTQMFHQLGSRLDHFHQNRPRFHQNRQRSTENPPQIAPVYIYILLQDVMLQTHSSPRREAASPPSPRCTTIKKSSYTEFSCSYTEFSCSYTQKAETLVAVNEAVIWAMAELSFTGRHLSYPSRRSLPKAGCGSTWIIGVKQARIEVDVGRERV